MIRYIVFDTETTGLDPFDGDKIIEIGAVELFDKKRSGKVYHQLINPGRRLSQEVKNITHFTDDMLNNQPFFKDIAEGFLSFINNKPDGCIQTYLVAHNASFDLKFLNYELKNIGLAGLSSFSVIDTLELARRAFPGQKATLDMLCVRFGISLEERQSQGHNAVLDCQILVDVFLKLLEITTTSSWQNSELDFVGFKKRENILVSRQYVVNDADYSQHIEFLHKNDIKFEN